MRQSKLVKWQYRPAFLAAVKGEPLRNVALISDGKIIRVAAVQNRRTMINKLLSWRKQYGPKFRECDWKINFND